MRPLSDVRPRCPSHRLAGAGKGPITEMLRPALSLVPITNTKTTQTLTLTHPSLSAQRRGWDLSSLCCSCPPTLGRAHAILVTDETRPQARAPPACGGSSELDEQQERGVAAGTVPVVPSEGTLRQRRSTAVGRPCDGECGCWAAQQGHPVQP